MSLDRTNPTPPRSVQENLAGYKTKAQRLESELARVRDLMNHANSEARAMDAQLSGIGDVLTRRHKAALDASAADPGRSDLAAAVRETRAALDSYEAITGRTP